MAKQPECRREGGCCLGGLIVGCRSTAQVRGAGSLWQGAGHHPPQHSHVCLHHPGRPNSPYSLTESDSSYTVSCGTPVLRQGSQHRPTNSSQQCLGKGVPGVPTAATSLAGPCQVAEHPPVLSETVAAPVKQKASFKIKDAKCHLHPRAKGKQEEAGKAGAQGEV